MTQTDFLAQLDDALRSVRLEVERVQDTFNVSQGTGIMAHNAHIDPRPLLERLSDDDALRRRQIAAYASGVKHVLLEPSRSKASQWDFVESAGGLIPGVHTTTFELGAEAAADQPPWSVDLIDDLRIVYFIKLDRGIRVLTTSQVERWDVSDDRITSAARSMLFHETRNLDFQPFDDSARVERLHRGDGHDAARFLVVADAFYSEIGAGFRFSIPSPDHLLCIRSADDEAVAELQQKTTEVYDEVDYPLCDRVFRFDSGTPVPIEESSDD